MNHYIKPLTIPTQPGHLLFPISLSKVEAWKWQSAQDIAQACGDIQPLIKKPGVWAKVIYSGELYGKYDDNYPKREKIVANYNTSLRNAINTFTPPSGIPFDNNYFTFDTWSQFRLWFGNDLTQILLAIRETLDKNTEFYTHMQADASTFGRELDEKQIQFFLEEHTMMTLTAKMKNDLWMILWHGPSKRNLRCYAGNPTAHHVYMLQHWLVWGNYDAKKRKQPHEYHRYNTTTKELLDITKINLDTYDLQSTY